MTSTDLVVLEKLTPAVIFAPGGVDDVIAKIASEVRSQHIDISTKAGREACASLAYKVARSKSALDKMGKDLGDANYKAWKAITAERAKIEEKLDELRDEVRKPLTDWENAEKDRVQGHEIAIEAILSAGQIPPQATVAEIDQRLAGLVNVVQRDWQEFAARAIDSNEGTRKALDGARADILKREAEAAELARLRAEEIARQQKERDDKIAAEAAERARIEAEQKAAREAKEAAAKAEAERLRVEQEKAADGCLQCIHLGGNVQIRS
jgi:septal ring factor EnvC (AmiA/AmiB activator)